MERRKWENRRKWESRRSWEMRGNWQEKLERWGKSNKKLESVKSK